MEAVAPCHDAPGDVLNASPTGAPPHVSTHMHLRSDNVMVVNAILRAFGHDLERAVMTSFPENPFDPGAGTRPAHMGRRPETEDVLSGILRRLRDGRGSSYMAFLYGPRGNGKTVLLHWLHAEAEKDGEQGAKIAVIRLSPTEMKSPASLAQAILDEMSASWSVDGLTAEATFGIPRVVGIRVTGEGKPRPLSLVQALSEEAGPLLLTLDEAHEARPKMLGELLNLVQRVGEARPMAAVFAGTPGLETVLLKARASFWSRGKQLPIGLLSETSAREALARPFRDAGLGADDEAVAKLATAADNYPYFLQLYGEAVWNVVEESGGQTLLPEHVTPAIEAADRQRQLYYRNRYREFSRARLLPLARKVAEAFVASADAPADRSLPDAALEELLAEQSNPVKAGEFLAAKGYVWQDEASGSLDWTPGIPSLMDYMIERIPAP